MLVMNSLIVKSKNCGLRWQKGCKLKAQERAVIVRLGDNHLPLLVNGVHIILVIEERLMYILLRHDTRNEYHEKKNTNKP